jgi:CheY-like chemotaxis protein
MRTNQADKGSSGTATPLQTHHRGTLKRRLLVRFLLIALVPLTAVSSISYYTAKRSLHDAAIEGLSASVEETAAYIENWFKYRFIDLESQATSVANVQFLSELIYSFNVGGKDLGEFVKSYGWNVTEDELAEDLKTFRRLYGYSDVFLIDTEGNILFTLGLKDDLGTNLFDGPLAGTRFAAACRKTLQTGEKGFSDLEPYLPSGEGVAGFFTSVIVDEYGDKIGLFAIQVTPEQVEYAVGKRARDSSEVQTYVVGYSPERDGVTLRAELGTVGPIGEAAGIRDSQPGGMRDYLSRLVDTEQTRLWMEGHGPNGTEIAEMAERGFIYDSSGGKPVLGIHRRVSVGDVPWGIIAEIPVRVAFAPARGLRNLVAGLLLITVLLVVIIVTKTTRRIVHPIVQLSGAARLVAQGDLSQSIHTGALDEIGDLGRAFAAMIATINDALDQADAISSGDYSADIKPRNDKDKLGIALQRMTVVLREISLAAEQVANGDTSLGIVERSSKDLLAQSFNRMVRVLKENQEENSLKEWILTGQMELSAVMRDNLDLPELCRDIVTFLAGYLNAEIGAIYITGDDQRLRLTGSYALSTRKRFSNEFDFGQGVVGQAALGQERILLTQVPEDYVAVSSGLGETTPRAIVVKPFVRDHQVLGVIELGALDSFSEKALEFLDLVSESIAVGVQTLLVHNRVQDLLEKSQTQTGELEGQQEELRKANESLERQTEALIKSEANLQAQQEELRQTNEELEEQTRLLEKQKNSISSKNSELERTRREIEQKAEDLQITSRYKSEFLANMSHELRTPLNSILLLSKHLSNNKDGNLTEKQVECASTVHISGNELLNLINDVLDLAKVESGKMILEPEHTAIKDMVGAMESNFRPVAQNKGIEFDIQIAEGAPETILTDSQRLAQILKNLLSNAFKFTEKGSVTLEICYRDSALPVTFMVKDTGTGIPKDKLETVFQAFNQVDGSTNRKYGGTGLGLSISRELVRALGGTIEVSSTLGRGSVFTLSLPETLDSKKDSDHAGPAALAQASADPGAPADTATVSPAAPEEAPPDREDVPDDRKTLTKESRSILIIEDDPRFARILRDAAREKGFKVLLAESGEIGLHLTNLHAPDGIILDMGLPGMDGKTVLFRLKDDLATRHIPVHIISASDMTTEPLRMGAVGYLTKPVTMEAIDGVFTRIERVISKKVKKVLVVEDNEVTRRLIAELVGNGTVKTVAASTGSEARTLLRKDDFDCIILDLGLPDMSGMDLLRELRKEEEFHTPVIIHTARDLTGEEKAVLEGFSDSIVIKDAKSREKLLDNTCLFLHRVEADLPEKKKEMIRRLHDRESILENKKILIVDDDMRNVFALISILQDKGINTVAAENGKEALSRLGENPDTDLVLMDIMMPEMDGYTAMREIRNPQSKIQNHDLPVIALTAKAMKGDRAKCIEAGASDYLSKPVDADKLLSMLRVWLY